MNLVKLASVVFAIVFMSGCAHRLTDFTVISSKNIELSKMGEYERQKARTIGIDKVHIVTFIPTGIPSVKEALDKAIESQPGGVALVDGVITRRSFYIPLIYGQDWFEVEGTLLVDPRFAN